MGFDALAPILLAAVVLIGAAVAAMALGSRLTGRCLRGSCGGPAPLDSEGKPIEACAGCPNRPPP